MWPPAGTINRTQLEMNRNEHIMLPYIPYFVIEALADEVSSRSLVERALEVVEAPHVTPSQDGSVRLGAA